MEQISVDVLDALKWRYAVKAFSNETLSKEVVDRLLTSIQLAPTAYGQQPFKALVIESKELREQLIPAAYGQDKVLNSSHLIVLAARTDLSDQTVDEYMQLAATTWNVPVENLSQFSDTVKGFYNGLTADQKIEWAKKQAYIALGTLLTAAAIEGIDACPMEGFIPEQVNSILNLEADNLTVACMIPIGVRSEDDPMAKNAKVRFDKKDLVIYK